MIIVSEFPAKKGSGLQHSFKGVEIQGWLKAFCHCAPRILQPPAAGMELTGKLHTIILTVVILPTTGPSGPELCVSPLSDVEVRHGRGRSEEEVTYFVEEGNGQQRWETVSDLYVL